MIILYASLYTDAIDAVSTSPVRGRATMSPILHDPAQISNTSAALLILYYRSISPCAALWTGLFFLLHWADTFPNHFVRIAERC